nr:TetR/AcrR family transcriptional regulator [uncultured Tolumonas sp.]
MLTKNAGSLREQVILAAKTLFMTYGYEAVGMRDIANAVGKQPVQVYRLDLSKADILAEVIIALNAEQIAELPRLYSQITGTTLFDRICSYLKQLYSLDVQYLPIRSVGAAFGWMWSKEHECRVIEQVGQLVKPVADWMLETGLDDIPARCIGIWSLYYVGYRQAVIHGGNADDCLNAIRPSLRFFLVSPDISTEDLIARKQIEEVTRLSEARLNRAELGKVRTSS